MAVFVLHYSRPGRWGTWSLRGDQVVKIPLSPGTHARAHSSTTDTYAVHDVLAVCRPSPPSPARGSAAVKRRTARGTWLPFDTVTVSRGRGRGRGRAWSLDETHRPAARNRHASPVLPLHHFLLGTEQSQNGVQAWNIINTRSRTCPEQSASFFVLVMEWAASPGPFRPFSNTYIIAKENENYRKLPHRPSFPGRSAAARLGVL